MDELRILRVELQERLLVSRQLEKIIFFGYKFRRPAARGAIGRLSRIAYVEVVVNAVAAFVFSLVDGVGRVPARAPHQILHRARVLRRSGADKMRVLNAEKFPQLD